jgi:hypothetical protein|tara:strand:- start:8724 stop:8930 length:207 start_codon:yes stop_codon:yes gene_type:complete
MSRCKACDVILTEQELKRVDKLTGLHLDLCNTCLRHSDSAIEEDMAQYGGEDELIIDVDDIIRQEVLH